MSMLPFRLLQVENITYHCVFTQYKDQTHGKIFKFNSPKRFKVFFENDEKQLTPVSDMDFKARNYEDLFNLIVTNIHPAISQKLSKTKKDPTDM